MGAMERRTDQDTEEQAAYTGVTQELTAPEVTLQRSPVI